MVIVEVTVEVAVVFAVVVAVDVPVDVGVVTMQSEKLPSCCHSIARLSMSTPLQSAVKSFAKPEGVQPNAADSLEPPSIPISPRETLEATLDKADAASLHVGPISFSLAEYCKSKAPATTAELHSNARSTLCVQDPTTWAIRIKIGAHRPGCETRRSPARSTHSKVPPVGVVVVELRVVLVSVTVVVVLVAVVVVPVAAVLVPVAVVEDSVTVVVVSTSVVLVPAAVVEDSVTVAVVSASVVVVPVSVVVVSVIVVVVSVPLMVVPVIQWWSIR